jgi:catechol 2,3-dioxygenase-like lactoylglutathione lyase family enzyme
MSESTKPRLVGINHVAIEVEDIDAALAFYGKIFSFTLRGKGERNAFIDIGDQFINLTLAAPRPSAEPERRHIGFVVDDRSSVRARAEAAGATILPGKFLDFLDPWGNCIEVVEYSNVQFTKAPQVLRGMQLELIKNDSARRELAEKGLGE